MGRLSKAQRWLLVRHFAQDGWTRLAQPTKADRRDIDILVRKGFLEPDDYGLHRITPAGRAALAEEEGR